MKSMISGIKLVARMVGWDGVGDESSQTPTLPEMIDD
jgi:hypothetical protein